MFLEQHKSLLTDFNGRIAQNCCLCSSYTKINETVLLSLPSSPFLVCSEIYMYVETHASPPGHSKLRATLLFFFCAGKQVQFLFLDKNQNILGNLPSHIRTVQNSRIIMIIKTLMNFRFVCFDGWMRPFLLSTKIAGFGVCGASYGKQVPPSSVT